MVHPIWTERGIDGNVLSSVGPGVRHVQIGAMRECVDKKVVDAHALAAHVHDFDYTPVDTSPDRFRAEIDFRGAAVDIARPLLAACRGATCHERSQPLVQMWGAAAKQEACPHHQSVRTGLEENLIDKPLAAPVVRDWIGRRRFIIISNASAEHRICRKQNDPLTREAFANAARGILRSP